MDQPNKVPDTAPSSSSTTKLASLLPIVDAFNYRHRNQHAASPWWSCFRLFRHGARALHDDLRRQQTLQAKLPAGDGGKKSSTSAKAKARTAQKQLLARVTLLRDRTVPKSYICFSQLVADNQYAALGLLLLSALASVNSILESIAPRSRPKEPALLSSSSSVSETQRPAQAPVKTQTSQPNPDDADSRSADKGVSVSREHLSGVSLKPPKATPVSRDDDDAVVRKRDADVPPPPEKQKKKNLVAQSREQPEEKVKKKKPKKKGKGDELSSLFGSL
ncbi:hypothetical protein PWT90_11030 [Aphanocladium album]|nr:hypothetical protein PWT90_11030 [Aphanocladium album]